MQADFSRSTFRPGLGYSAVVSQQGRVQLDADANEQAAIQLHLARVTAADVIGRHGGPADGFTVRYVPGSGKKPADLAISPGRYYVDGILVDSTSPAVHRAVGDAPAPDDPPVLGYWNQPFAHLDPENRDDLLPDFAFLVYLRVTERLVTAVQDPLIRESALGAALPDTGARTQVTWQVLATGDLGDQKDPRGAFDEWVAERTAEFAHLAARVQKPDGTDDDPCVLAPDAAYRGPENQLYRVEIHNGGPAGTATFKWSRENGSVVFPVTEVDGHWVTLAALGRDDKLAIEVGDRVEAADDATAARGEARPLLRVDELDPAGRRVLLSHRPDLGPAGHALLRRWDQRQPHLHDGAVSVTEGAWLDLEDGVQVQFASEGTYRTGDYWLIPARTLTADVEWPVDAADRPLLLPPMGEPAHYAPLAWVTSPRQMTELRRTFQHLPTLDRS